MWLQAAINESIISFTYPIYSVIIKDVRMFKIDILDVFWIFCWERKLHPKIISNASWANNVMSDFHMMS